MPGISQEANLLQQILSVFIWHASSDLHQYHKTILKPFYLGLYLEKIVLKHESWKFIRRVRLTQSYLESFFEKSYYK